jgi:thymidylate kinase
MQHKLVIFTGSSPGVGKSTLSRLLFEQLNALSIRVRWLHEDDIAEVFERFIPGMTIEALTPDLLLQASRMLVEECESENSTWIIDSYLPGFYYLYGRYSNTQLEAFSTELQSILKPLRPLVIYLRSDVEIALMRGVTQRGKQWLENLTRYLNGWQLPVYGGNGLKPLRTVSDVINFFTRVDTLAVALLEKWQNAVILDTTKLSVSPLLTTILSHLGLTKHNTGSSVPIVELRRYIGIYIPLDSEWLSEPLEISLVNNELFVNTYWPSGTRLIPEGETNFRLDGTNHHIAFDVQSEGLTYYYGEATHKYKKRG